MKLLLTIIMSTLVSATAFGACSTEKPGDCKDQSSCEKLSVKGGLEFVFSGKCMVKDTAVATNCLQVSDSTVGKGSPASGSSSSESSGTRGSGR